MITFALMTMLTIPGGSLWWEYDKSCVDHDDDIGRKFWWINLVLLLIILGGSFWCKSDKTCVDDADDTRRNLFYETMIHLVFIKNMERLQTKRHVPCTGCSFFAGQWTHHDMVAWSHSWTCSGATELHSRASIIESFQAVPFCRRVSPPCVVGNALQILLLR